MAPDMASATSCAQRAALLTVLLLLCGTASPAVVRGPRLHPANPANDEVSRLMEVVQEDLVYLVPCGDSKVAPIELCFPRCIEVRRVLAESGRSGSQWG